MPRQWALPVTLRRLGLESHVPQNLSGGDSRIALIVNQGELYVGRGECGLRDGRTRLAADLLSDLFQGVVAR
ncbi:hypothetical protein [Streptomyces sp. NPDC048272]|uniref:hypothetical protein n=1 Tax=Streptomyces sp. NPDC048272 TaxID=3154616 RepID=UPI003435C5EA